jgi:hypothetical protein
MNEPRDPRTFPKRTDMYDPAAVEAICEVMSSAARLE